jgi:hypothetical protein
MLTCLPVFIEGLLTSWLQAARAFDSDQGRGAAESVDKWKMSDWRETRCFLVPSLAEKHIMKMLPAQS